MGNVDVANTTAVAGEGGIQANPGAAAAPGNLVTPSSGNLNTDNVASPSLSVIPINQPGNYAAFSGESALLMGVDDIPEIEATPNAATPNVNIETEPRRGEDEGAA